MSESSIHDNHYVAFNPDHHHHHHHHHDHNHNHAHHSEAWSDSSSQSRLIYDRKRRQQLVPENFVVKNIENDDVNNEAENNNKISLIFCIAIIIVAIIGLIVALVFIIFSSSTGT